MKRIKLTEKESRDLAREIIWKYGRPGAQVLSVKEMRKVYENTKLFYGKDEKQMEKEIGLTDKSEVSRHTLEQYLITNIKKKIDIDQRCKLFFIERQLNSQEAHNLSNQIFYQFDRDFNGELEIKELSKFLYKTNIFDSQDTASLINKIDSNSDKKISKNELVNFLKLYLKFDEAIQID